MLLKSFYSAIPLGSTEKGLLVVPLKYTILT